MKELKGKDPGDNLVINIGLIGLGYIGSEVFRLIQGQRDYIMKKIGKDLRIKTVAEKFISSKKDFTAKYKSVKFTDDANQIINDPEIDIVVELIGGINPAYDTYWQH